MTTKPSYTPALRFPDFLNDGEWEDYSIEEVFDIRNGYTPSKSKAEYWENGTIPWFRMEDIRANGNILSDSIQHITPEAIKGFGLLPAYSIIVATSATIGEHALITVESLANQRFTYLSKKKSFEERVDMMYFHYYMFVIDEWCKKNTNTGGFLSVNMSAFRQLRIPLPPLPEQRRIAQALTALDELIAATNEKLEQMKAYKKGLMQQLFVDSMGGKLLKINYLQISKLRFPEFYEEKEWEEKKLGEVAMKITNKNKNNQTFLVLTNSATEGVISQQNYFDREIVSKENLSNYYIIEIDDFVYNPRISVAAPVGPISRNRIDKGVMSPLYTIFRFKEGDIDFYEQFFRTNCWHQYLKDKANFGARFDRMNISNEDFMNMPIPTPSLSEQRKIASCLSTMDETINAYTEKVGLLGQFKKGLMQGMFPQNQMN